MTAEVTAGATVEQWSFCTKCKGSPIGCNECTGGVVVELIPLESLQKPIQYEYVRLQRRFVHEQRPGAEKMLKGDRT